MTVNNEKHWHNQIWRIQKERGETFRDIEKVWVSWYMDKDGEHHNSVMLDRDEAWNFFLKYNPTTVIYTKNTIIITVIYDGDDWLDWVPRNPEEGMQVPQYGGG